MRVALLLCLLVASGAHAQTRTRAHCRGRTCRGPTPLFAFLTPTPSGAQVATGVMPPTARGGAVTLTRTGSKSCTREDGSTATLTDNQPCVQTSGLFVGAGETASAAMPANLSRTEGCARACITPTWTGLPVAEKRYLETNGSGATESTARFFYSISNTNTVRAYDGTNVASVPAGFLSGVRQCFLTDWSAARGLLRVTNLATGASSQVSGFTTFPAFGATVLLGVNHAPARQAEAYLSDVRLGSAWDACR